MTWSRRWTDRWRSERSACWKKPGKPGRLAPARLNGAARRIHDRREEACQLTNSSRTVDHAGSGPLLVRAGALLACALLVSGLAGSTARVRASDEAVLPSPKEVGDEFRTMSHRLEAAEGELALARVQIERANAVFKYSSHYQIPADLTASIYDIALSEGIEPEVGFRLVQIESNFKLKALSYAGAVGLYPDPAGHGEVL